MSYNVLWSLYVGDNQWVDTGESWEMKFPLPGSKEEDIKVKLVSDKLKVSCVENEFVSSIEKTWTMPKDVKGKDVSAKYNAGVLTVSIAKPKDHEVDIKVTS